MHGGVLECVVNSSFFLLFFFFFFDICDYIAGSWNRQ